MVLETILDFMLYIFLNVLEVLQIKSNFIFVLFELMYEPFSQVVNIFLFQHFVQFYLCVSIESEPSVSYFRRNQMIFGTMKMSD